MTCFDPGCCLSGTCLRFFVQKGLYGPFKGTYEEYENKFRIFIYKFMNLVFPKFSTLEVKHQKFGHQIRILRKKSSLEPAPKVWEPMSKSHVREYNPLIGIEQ